MSRSESQAMFERRGALLRGRLRLRSEPKEGTLQVVQPTSEHSANRLTNRLVGSLASVRHLRRLNHCESIIPINAPTSVCNRNRRNRSGWNHLIHRDRLSAPKMRIVVRRIARFSRFFAQSASIAQARIGNRWLADCRSSSGFPVIAQAGRVRFELFFF